MPLKTKGEMGCFMLKSQALSGCLCCETEWKFPERTVSSDCCMIYRCMDMYVLVGGECQLLYNCSSTRRIGIVAKYLQRAAAEK